MSRRQGGALDHQADNFTNQGTITVANGDTLHIAILATASHNAAGGRITVSGSGVDRTIG